MSTTQSRPVWWTPTHERALAALSDSKWTPLTSLLSQGFGCLVFCELNQAGYADRRIEMPNDKVVIPSEHIFYRKAAGL